MKRGTTKEKTTRLLDRMRSAVPGMAIRTTLIVGYPGETESDFNELLAWVKEMRFDRLGVFPYSHEENTTAYVLVDDVPAEEKQRRADAIMEAQMEISAEMNALRVGQTLRVLVDRVEGEHYVGRTEFDSPDVDNEVWIPFGAYSLTPGRFATVKIIDATEYDLHAELVP
jgi:ribosomal protein S12 methylthiotransferase